MTIHVLIASILRRASFTVAVSLLATLAGCGPQSGDRYVETATGRAYTVIARGYTPDMLAEAEALAEPGIAVVDRTDPEVEGAIVLREGTGGEADAGSDTFLVVGRTEFESAFEPAD